MIEHIHLIGIGGIGMSAIAQLLLHKDIYKVSGCDLKQNDLIRDLRKAGVEIELGHNAKHLRNADTVVYSSAILEDNPEIQEARRRGIKLMKRAEILSSLMQDKTVVTVTGMHGKTTSASLAAHLLSEAGLFPTVAVGGILHNLGGNALLGEGRFFVAEADESDGSFLCYRPDYSIITNIDYEHLDYYKHFDAVKETFRHFINQTKNGGCLFYWQDDPYLSNLLRDYKEKAVSFGLNQNAQIYAREIILDGFNSEFDCMREEKFVGRFKIGLGGRHNILNALAVIALGLELGIDRELIKSALISYRGTRRRLEIKFQSEEILVLDDYGHHPTEIKATLETVKLLNPRRLLVIFQPHRYTRTKLLLEDFAGSFDLADFVIITDIYPAGESIIKGVDSRAICEKMKSGRHQQARFLPKKDIVQKVLKMLDLPADYAGEGKDRIAAGANRRDIILVLGAGDITRISDELAEVFKRQTKGKRGLSKAYQL